MKTRKVLFKTAIIILPIALIIGGAFLWLSLASYSAGETAEAALISDESVTVREEGGLLIFEPESYDRGLIFYPGGMVDHKAYAPLMREIAEEGYLAVIVEMPLDFAFLNMNGALDVIDAFPKVESWTLAGHSLGGAMAASHAAKYAEKYDTLLLLAAYSTEDLTEIGIEVISVYGEYDGVLNFENYTENKDNLPSDFVEIVIYGGNHAMFGDYGEQKGDGDGHITPEEQIAAVVNILG